MKTAFQRFLAALLGLWLLVGGLWPASAVCHGTSSTGLRAGACCKPSEQRPAHCCDRDCCLVGNPQEPLQNPAAPTPPPLPDPSAWAPAPRILFELAPPPAATPARPDAPASPSLDAAIPLFLRDRTLLI